MADGSRRPIGPEDPSREVDRELRFHLEMRAREFEAEGMSPEDARRAAAAAFGDVAEVAESCRLERRRRARRIRLRAVFGDVGADVRIAGRVLRREPAFAAAAVLVLAIGIAIVVAAAGLVDAYLLSGLPFPQSERLVYVQGRSTPDWREAPAILEVPVSWDLDVLHIVGGERPDRAWTSWVSPGFFEALGVRVQLGRLPMEADAAPGAPAVAVISHALWQRRWGGDSDVVGTTFTAYASDRPEEAEVFTIVGVLPADHWHFNRFYEVLSPLREGRMTYMARLAAGVTPAAARAALERDARERTGEATEVRVVPVHEAYVAGVRPTLFALVGAVLLVLAIACGNAAVLLLVRAAGRDREFSVRAALGAGRTRLARQLVVEGLVLSGVAGVLGITLGIALLRVTGELIPRTLGTPVPGGGAALGVNGTAVLVAVGATVVAGVLFGAAPLAGALRVDLARGVANGSRAGVGRGRGRLRDLLVGVELALSLALLVGAGLLVRSATHLQRLTLGFSPDGVVAVGFGIRQSRYPDAETRAAFYERVVATIESRVPGTDAEIANWAPFARLGTSGVETPTLPAAAVEEPPQATVTTVGPGYFHQMRISILRGRRFEAGDRLDAQRVAIVSAALAARLWPGRDPIGEQIRPAAMAGMGDARPGPWLTVVGVSGEVRKTLTEENPADLYLPVAQNPPVGGEILIRDASGRDRLEQVREAIWSLDAEIPLEGVRVLSESVAVASLPNRFLAAVLGGFAGFAALLAVLGLYGVVSYAVSRQQRDIAIRMALGARSPGVVGLYLRRNLPVLLLGLLAGVAAGAWLARLLVSQLHGVTPLDLPTYAAVAALLVGAAVLATAVPALRASRITPMRALRTD